VDVDLDQGTIVGQPHLEVERFRGLNSFPDWSPDGRYLAYVSGRPESNSYVISIRDEETGEERELPPTLARFMDLRWSPNGKYFLAQGQDVDQHGGLFLIDVQSGEVRSVLQASDVIGAGFDAQWLPDGRMIVYATNARRPEVVSRIVVLDSETGTEQEVLRMGDLRLIGFLALSPDGKTLAFTASRLEGGPDGGALTNLTLTVMPSSGGQTTDLLQVELPELIGSLAWSHDSSSILFMRVKMGGQASQQGVGPLWQVPAAGGEPRQLGVIPNQWQRQRLSLHPDGHRIAYTRAERKFEIWAMDGLFADTSAE